ncbi:aromatic amino acid transaminase [Porphyrobacter sp. AAP60]|uniref:amino acid aminotransferase n=1 Tax=Porphyrobacter sp. AAP60 TaxID=1523423 RepID=UPI0006B97C87|nr:aromatic amino acid transaminase [Porphyrobacter sp. AAP60]KPF62751.1 aromatic amino acid aminotransferase [Porphyrobacter sp. AAP60]
MLDRLSPQAPDALLALIRLHAADPREDKIDLGVGVYRTDDGATPVFAAIKSAEQQLIDTQDSKSYLGPEGDMGFVNALMPYVFGANATMGGRVAGMQTPGGTGAVRLALALAQKAGVKRVHMGVPSWPNHAQILADLGLELVAFDHSRPDGTANLDAVIAAINGAGDDEAVLLHACCHNPTGIDYTAEQWAAIADAFAASGTFPIIDSAYQGLGHGLEEDAAGMRAVLAAVPEAFVAYSCDKNFGQYRDRVGAFYILGNGQESLDTAFSNANALARAAWSMPPDHGGAAVRIILRDPDMTEAWLAELDTMRARMRQVRDALAAEGQAGRIDLTPLGIQNGLFSMLPVTKDEVAALREDHGIYMAASGRINIAGLTMANLPKFIAALAAVAV